MLVLLIYANVAFLQFNVNNLAWATTGDAITMQSQFQKFTLFFPQLIRQPLRETERDRDTEAEIEKKPEKKGRKEKGGMSFGFQIPTQKVPILSGFYFLLKSLLWCKFLSEQSSNKEVLCLHCLHYGWV